LVAETSEIADREPRPPAPRQGAPLSMRLREVAEDYQRKLVQNPSNIEALIGMTLVALASRQNQAAVQMAQAAVAEAPEKSVAWVTLGQALKADARLDEAESAYREAIRLDGVNPLARMGLGELQTAAGKPTEAIHEY